MLRRLVAFASEPRCALWAGLALAAVVLVAGTILTVPGLVTGLGVAACLLAPVWLVAERQRARQFALLKTLARVADAVEAPSRSHQDLAGAARAIETDNAWWRERLGLPEAAVFRRERLDQLIAARRSFAEECETARRKAGQTALAVERMPELCRLAETQLGAIRRDGETAAWQMMESLRILDGQVEAAVGSTALFRADPAFGETREEGIVPLRGALAARLDTHKAAAAERARAAAAAQERVQETADAAFREAEAVAAEIHRFGQLAFNATIESTRAGQGASGTAVVAKEMVDHAARTSAASERLHAALEALMKTAAVQCGEVETRADKEQRDLARLDESLARLSAAIDRASREQAAFAERMDTFFHLMSDTIMNAVGQLQTQDIQRQMAESLEKTFADLGTFGSELAVFLTDEARSDIGDISHLIEGLRSRYVTHGERRTDAMVSGNGVAGAGEELPAIELF